MRTRMTAIALAVAILPAAISRTEAGPLGGRMRGHGGAQAARAQIADLEQQLNLSDAQKQQVQSIMTQERHRAMPLVMRLMQGRKAMQSATASGTFDEAQVRTAAAQQAQTITDLMVEAERVKSEVSAVLTPDQRAKFTRLIDQKRSELRQRFSNLPAAQSTL